MRSAKNMVFPSLKKVTGKEKATMNGKLTKGADPGKPSLKKILMKWLKSQILMKSSYS